jgi:hypothetical protein
MVMYYYYKGEKCLYKIAYPFANEEITRLGLVQITEEEFDQLCEVANNPKE